MKKLSAKVKRPLWVAGLNIALALTVGSTRAFASPDINSVADLLAVSGGANYVLRVNLDLANDDASLAEGEQRADEETLNDPSYIDDGFTGTFDGGGFTISGLTKPLFSVIESTGVISNLSLEADPTFGVSGRGILANESYGTINSVSTIGNVLSNTNSVGGLVGYSGGSISDSSATGNVTGPSNVGGLVGVTQGSISGSSSVGNVNGDVAVGGLVGDSNGSISNSSASGDVTGNFYVGGLVGNSTSSISGSYAEGDVVSTNSFTGGLVGYSTAEISNSYANGDVTGDNYVGGLAGQTWGNISNSYANGDVTGDNYVGGLAGSALGEISNSYASGNIEFDIASLNDDSGFFGGLAGEAAYQPITNSYASGSIEFDIESLNADSRFVGGFLGFKGPADVVESYASGNVNDTPCVEPCSPLTATELLAILNTGFEGAPIFTFNPSVNGGRPYLISNNPFSDEDEEEDEVVEIFRRVNISFLPTQALNGLSKSVGFEAAKSDLSKLDLALLDQVKGDKSEQITGAKLFANQSLTTSLSVGSLLQLEINFEANKSLQMWVKSSDGQYVLIGDITFDKDGNAVLPGIGFKKSGSYELIFVNSDKKDLTQPKLVNKVSGLTVYVN
jgi:hypothetical protein